jgi:hypothetical protein
VSGLAIQSPMLPCMPTYSLRQSHAQSASQVSMASLSPSLQVRLSELTTDYAYAHSLSRTHDYIYVASQHNFT